MTVGGRVGALWIGGLEPYMDEAFLQVTYRLIALICSYCILYDTELITYGGLITCEGGFTKL